MRIFFLLSLALVLTGFGCASVQDHPVREDPVPAASSPMPLQPYHHVYAIKDGLDLQVTFESRKAYDAAQLGLFLLSQSEKRETPVTVEDTDFFPRYFSIINVNINDGLLFISEEEATRFAKTAYLNYQGSVAMEVDLRNFREPHILSEIVKR